MTTKVYGVDMEVLQKLFQFQFLLKKRKFSKAFDKMEFMAYVQIKTEILTIPEIISIAVANTNILIDEGIYRIPKFMILRIEKNNDNNHVIVKFKRPVYGLGLFISLDFKNEGEKQDFLAAIGEIESDESDVGEPQPSSDDAQD